MRHGVLVGVVCLLAGCSPAGSPGSREADVRVIRELEAAWARDVGAKNLERWAGYYAEDGSILLPNSPPVTGRDNIRAALQAKLSDPHFSLTFRPAKIEASDSLAYAQGAYSLTTTDPKTREIVTDQGKYVTVYRKQADGSWKAVQDMASSDMPRPIEAP